MTILTFTTTHGDKGVDSNARVPATLCGLGLSMRGPYYMINTARTRPGRQG